MTQLARFGFVCVRTSASGQRKKKRREEATVPADILAFSVHGISLPDVAVEIGGSGKRIEVTFAELESITHHHLARGFVPLVGMIVRRKWYWYTAPRHRHHSLAEALLALVGDEGGARRILALAQTKTSKRKVTRAKRPLPVQEKDVEMAA